MKSVTIIIFVGFIDRCGILSIDYSIIRLIMPALYTVYSCLSLESKKLTLRKHAYSNVLKILPPKNENFQRKKSDIFLISAQNIDCGYSLEPPRRGGSNEYPQSMF